MLLSIPKAQVRKGMFIESVACPYREFGKQRFLLTSDKDIEAIALSSADVVLINLARGLNQYGRVTCLDGNVASESHNSKTGKLPIREDLDRHVSAMNVALDDIVKGGRSDLTILVPLAESVDESWSDNPVVAFQLTRMKAKDKVTYAHSMAVSGLMSLLARSLGMDETTVKDLGVAGILHDVGKLLIPKAILCKSGELTPRERMVIRNHPEAGYELLKTHQDISPMILDVCRLHHEMLDGSGYPLGLKAAKLELHVRVSTVCDVFEALTSIRPYKQPWTTEQAIKWMFERPQQFDRKLVIRLGSLAASGGCN